jgi:hypothetical protein
LISSRFRDISSAHFSGGDALQVFTFYGVGKDSRALYEVTPYPEDEWKGRVIRTLSLPERQPVRMRQSLVVRSLTYAPNNRLDANTRELGQQLHIDIVENVPTFPLSFVHLAEFLRVQGSTASRLFMYGVVHLYFAEWTGERLYTLGEPNRILLIELRDRPDELDSPLLPSPPPLEMVMSL